MPPRVKYDRKAVLDAAFAIARREGMAAVNARAVANELGCSTQPLFREFQSMEQIRAELVQMAREKYNSYIALSPTLDERPYKGTGMAYVLFARDEPQLFRLLFMRDRIHEGTQDIFDDDNLEYIFDAIVKSTGYTRDQAAEFHQMISIFTHGLATMVATNFVSYDHDGTSRLLSNAFVSTQLFFRERAAQAAASGDSTGGKDEKKKK